MKKILRLFVYSVIGLFVYSFIMPRAYARASGEFQADYEVQYAIAPTGVTIVTQNITLTNKQTNLYPLKYSIVLDTTKIKNVIAYDSKSIAATDISQNDGKTTIVLSFNDRVVGVGKQLSFTLRFENGDVAQKNGSIWEVNIPGIVPDVDINTYNVSLSVPNSFGPNAYMTPLPALGNKWNKEQMMTGGISAAYGNMQSFDINLSYYIDNPRIAPVQTEIALPPDTAFQTVVIKSLDPKPVNVLWDEDGNWLAQYTLLPGGHQAIEAKLHVDVSLKPKDGYTEAITDPTVYTRSQKYWESKDASIEDLAKKYTTPRAIYQYVATTLSYDYARVKTTPIRKGALQALLAPKNSICMEFTDLFVAIARAAGIPAREAVGYAYTTNSRLRPLSLVADVLHAWPEYYDSAKNIWIPVDPTWANTTGGVNYFDKLDFNHIVFALHGKASDYPYPAGFYRQNDKTTKDVSVAFATTPFTVPIGKLATSFSFPSLITAGITARGTVMVENTVGVSVPEATIVLQSSPVDVKTTKKETMLPPFAKITLPLSITVPNYFSGGKGRLLAMVNGESSQYQFSIQPITNYFIVPILSFGGILVILIFLLVRRTKLWKHRHKKQ